MYTTQTQELKGGHPGRVGLYLYIDVSPSPNMGKLVKNKYRG